MRVDERALESLKPSILREQTESLDHRNLGRPAELDVCGEVHDGLMI
jgi:hypothetical protein